jgi:hypothetical protein
MVSLNEIRKIGANIGRDWMWVDRRQLWPKRRMSEGEKVASSAEQREKCECLQ